MSMPDWLVMALLTISITCTVYMNYKDSDK